MKNPLSHILICLIVLSTSLANAQTQSNNSDIYTDNSVLGKFITKVKERKEKKYEFYFSYYKPNFRTEEYTEWSRPFFSNNKEEPNVSFEKQQKIKHRDKIYGTHGVSFGCNKIKHLYNRWNVKYGFGFTVFGFYHIPKVEVIEEIILSKHTFLNNGPFFLEEKINDQKYYEKLNGYVYNNSEPSYVAASILFPFSLEYKVQENLLFGGDISFSVPISAEESKIYYDSYFKKETRIYTPTTKILEVIPQAGFHIKYKFANYFYTSINASTGIVLRTYELSEDKKYNEFHKLEPIYYSYGLTLGVNI